VQTGFEAVDVNKFAISIPQIDRINHLVVFVFGDPFPMGFAGTGNLVFTSRLIFISQD
jgi:hypothetical protein